MKTVLQLITFAIVAVSLDAASLPAWVKAESASQQPAAIIAVYAGAAHDLVALNSGAEQGLRQGMVMRVALGEDAVARLLLAQVGAERAVALILDLPAGHTLSAGDQAYPSVIRI